MMVSRGMVLGYELGQDIKLIRINLLQTQFTVTNQTLISNTHMSTLQPPTSFPPLSTFANQEIHSLSEHFINSSFIIV